MLFVSTRRFIAGCLLAGFLGVPVWIPRIAIAQAPAGDTPVRTNWLVGQTLQPLTDGPIVSDAGRDLASDDFAVGLKVRLPQRFTDDLGDLISLWDPQTRQGFQLSVVHHQGTSGQANRRQLQFGIDAASEPQWRDEGRPGQAILGFGLAVHQGDLHVSTVEGGPALDAAGGQTGVATGKVYRYRGPGQWESLGSPDGANAITALATFDGDLYAGSGKYRLGGSALAESENPTLGGKVFRYAGEGQWQFIGQLPGTEAISSFAEFDGKLYASSLYRPAGFFRYDGDGQWATLPVPVVTTSDAAAAENTNAGVRVNALGVHGGSLYATSYDNGHVFRFDGQQWHDLGMVDSDITQNYSFVTWDDALHVSTWPTGKVYRLDGDGNWIDCGRLGEETEVMAMSVYNGSFYAGTLPLAEVYRYAGDTRWQRLRQIDLTPNVQYRRVWTMATWQGRLFATTLPSGSIWSLTAGAIVTYDQELSDDWHEVVARRQAGQLRLWVDGQLVAETDAHDLSLATEGLPLQIGSGPRGRFPGQITEVWFER